jgi:hypothetical protein
VPVVLSPEAVNRNRTRARAKRSQETALTPFELVHPGGVVLRVPVGADRGTLATILDVLERRSC